MEMIYKFLEYELFHYKDNSLIVFEVIAVILIFIGAKIVLWLINNLINRKHKFNKLNTGRSFALFQIIKYIVWIIAIGLMLEAVGIKLTFLLAGSAALLVGVGLGLQQTFNDVLSGIILLFDRSLNVGDILDIDGDVVIIQEIGFRTSKGLNRKQIIVTLPNSLLTTNKVINWSNQSMKTLFSINVGVAYGSDVELVMKVLNESAMEHPDVLNKELVESRFINFGDSSLDFKLLFYSKNLFRIERVKSDIRIIINRKFNENNISIPFPQMDLHLKSRID
jgi:small-conductance mechanosensitive channel